MKINQTHVKKYLALRTDVKAYEVEMSELKDKFMEVLKASLGQSIETPAGRVTLVTKEINRLDEEKLMKALGVISLDAFKTPSTVESVLVTAS